MISNVAGSGLSGPKTEAIGGYVPTDAECVVRIWAMMRDPNGHLYPREQHWISVSLGHMFGKRQASIDCRQGCKSSFGAWKVTLHKCVLTLARRQWAVYLGRCAKCGAVHFQAAILAA